MLRIFVLWLAKLMGLFALSRVLTRGQLRILCYHGIWLGPQPHYGDCLFMSAERFRQRMSLLARRGYRVITLAHGCNDLESDRVSSRDVVITIDDAWVGTFLHMLPVLKEHAFPATLYVTTENVVGQEPVIYVLAAYLAARSGPDVDLSRLFPDQKLDGRPPSHLAQTLAGQILSKPTAEARREETERLASLLGIDFADLEMRRAFLLMTPAEVRQAHHDGVDIQLHTHSHRMHGFNHERLRAEIQANRDELASMLGTDSSQLEHFCYPSGLYQPSIFPVLRECGIKSATTTEFGLNPPGTSPFALKRILDCESLSDIELEARLSGFWTTLSAVRSVFGRLSPGSRKAGTAAKHKAHEKLA